MAQQVIQLEREKLSFSICLGLLKDPVTIPCGHNYCMSCIKNYWDKDEKETHSCPQCRQSFTPRPPLVKNTMFAEIVDELKTTGLSAAAPDHFYAGPEDVACDLCTGRKLKAFKSCLVCMASYCEHPLLPHSTAAPLKKHKLVNATSKLQENICRQHEEVMKIYCRTDQKCICYLCSLDEHKGHDTASAAAEWAERQTEVKENLKIIQKSLQDREKDVKMLQKDADTINLSADKAASDSEKIFKDLIAVFEIKSCEVLQNIRYQQKTSMSQVKELTEKMQQEITELERRKAELEQISSTEDHLQILNNYSFPSLPSTSTNQPTINLQPQNYFEEVRMSVSTMRDKLLTTLSEDSKKTLQGSSEVVVQEPTTRHNLLKYARHISLDPDTANSYLSLSRDNRKATLMEEEQFDCSHPKRFQNWWQVLSLNGLTGCCYWEVKLKGKVLIAVAYRNISRKGSRVASGFGNNDHSWALECAGSGCTFRHNNISTPVSGPTPSRVGVFLDHSAGILSFYSITCTMELLHKVRTTFTQPLYPGFWLLRAGGYVELACSAQ